MKITKVYTRGGDMGKTSLVGGQRVSKGKPQETRVLSLGLEDPLEKGTTTHSSILFWRSP